MANLPFAPRCPSRLVSAPARRRSWSEASFGFRGQKDTQSSCQSCHCIAALSFSTFGIEDVPYNRKVADPNIMDLSSCWWSTEPDLCGGVCFYELVLTKIACWHLQCGRMEHFRGLGFRDLSWCGQFRFQMFHMIKESKSGLSLKKEPWAGWASIKTCALIAVCTSSKAWQDDESIRNFPKSSHRQAENIKIWKLSQVAFWTPFWERWPFTGLRGLRWFWEC